MKQRIAAFVVLSRPHFLAGGILPFLAGTIVGSGGEPNWGRYALGQAMITLAQLATQYTNEYYDRDADAAVATRTPFSGGSGVLVSGALPPRAAAWAAATTGAAAVVVAFVLAVDEPIAGLLGLAAVGGGVFYSAPPLRLVATAYGEAVASFIVAALVPVTGAVIQGSVPVDLIPMIALLTGLHSAMILGFALPDIEGDASVGKRNAAVRLGPGATVRAIRILLGASGVVWVAGVAFLPAEVSLATLPAALPATLTAALTGRPGTAAGLATFTAAATFALAAAGQVVGSALAY